MSDRQPLFTRSAILLLCIFLVSACGTTPASRFYMLSPLASPREQQIVGGEKRDVVIGLLPVEFPPYLQRPQIVSRSAGAEVHLAQTHRWAEPLQDNFTRVMADNLSALMNTATVISYPSLNWSNIDYRIVIDVTRFDSDPDGIVTLETQWSLLNHRQTQTAIIKTSRLTTRAHSSSYDDIVSAYSEAVLLLSREIAAAVNNIQRGT